MYEHTYRNPKTQYIFNIIPVIVYKCYKPKLSKLSQNFR